MTSDKSFSRSRIERLRTVSALAGGFVVIGLLSSPATAQTQIAPSDESSQSDIVPDIVVTATKRAEPISKVGGGISAFSGVKLEERGAESLKDYIAFIPGITLDSNGSVGHGTLQIRGVAAQSIGAAVSTYIDDIPVGASSAVSRGGQFAVDIDPTDLERVEVLKGPQGTLYGASSMGGVIKYVTRQPSLTHLEIKSSEDVSGTAGGTPSVKLRASVSTPIVHDTLAIRLSGYYRHDGGYTDVVGGPKNFNSNDDWGFRGALFYKPDDRLSIKLNAMIQNSSGQGNSTMDVDGTTLEPVYGDLKQQKYTEAFKLRNSLLSAEINYDFGKVNLVSATGYSKLRPYEFDDLTVAYTALGLPFGSPSTPLAGPGIDKVSKFTQELRLVSQRMGPFEWIVGGFYQHERPESISLFYQYNTDGTRTSLPPLDELYRRGTLDEIAGFGNLTFYITDKLDVTGGYRHSSIHQTNFTSDNGLLSSPDDPYTPTLTHRKFSEKSDTYLAGIRWRATTDLLLYGRAASGYRPGGGRPIPTTAPPGTKDYYVSDTLWSYEAGVKFRGLNGKLSIDADGFWIDWKNIQSLEAFPPFLTDGNAGDARSRGFEIQVDFAPIKGLNVGANTAYTDAKYTTDSPAIGVVAGDRLRLVPEHTAAGYIDYSHALNSRWDSFAGVDFQYQSKRLGFYDPLPGFTIYNANIGIRNGAYRINLYVQNLTNKRAALGEGLAGVPGFPIQLAINRPRTIGIQFSQNF